MGRVQTQVEELPENKVRLSVEVPSADVQHAVEHAAGARVPEELVQQELDVLRHAVAELAPVESRPGAAGDTAVVDLVSASGEAQRDYVVEIGSGRLVEELEAALVGMSAGETKEVEYELADDSMTKVEVTVKELKEKVLPSLDDDLARSASEFDSL